MAPEENNLQQTVTRDQETPTNGQGTQHQTSQSDAPPNSQDTGKPQSAAPPEPTTIQFSQQEYSAKRRPLITVTRTGSTAGEMKIDFTAKEEGTPDGDFLKTETLTFGSGEPFKTILLAVRPNWSETTAKVNLELSNPQNAQLGDPHKAAVFVQPIGYFRGLAWDFARNSRVGRVTRHVALGLLLIGGILLIDLIVGFYADRYKKDWDQYLNPEQYLSSGQKPVLTFPANTPIKDYEQERLTDQLHRIRLKEGFHLRLMEFYYKGYYMGIIVLSFTAALAAITLVIISKGGWAQTSEYIITTFFIMTCASLFYGSWPGLFKQEDNITNNKVLYLKFTALENELLGYATTDEALNYNFVSLAELKPQPTSTTASHDSATAAPDTRTEAREKPTPESSSTKTAAQENATKIGIRVSATDFIHYVDLQLAQDNIAIGFDYSQIPNYKNAFANIGNTK